MSVLTIRNSFLDQATEITELKNTVGVVDHGLFIDMSTAVIVAGSDGVYVKKP